MSTKNNITKRIETCIDQLDNSMRSQDYDATKELIPDILKFESILTDERIEFTRAEEYAIESNIQWRP